MNDEFNKYAAKEWPRDYASDSLDSRFVTIRNGTIDLANGKETSVALALDNIWVPDMFKSRYSYSPYTDHFELRPGQQLPDLPAPYVRNEYLIEHMHLYARDIAVLIEGGYNTIRNCVIHSGGQAAVIAAGPHLTIENCEIWLKPPADKGHVDPELPWAAIILRDASHAVIRNNVIRTDRRASDMPNTPGQNGWPDLKKHVSDPLAGQAHVILVRDGASDVLIENNTFENLPGDPVTLVEGSGATLRGNRERTALSFRPLPDRVVPHDPGPMEAKRARNRERNAESRRLFAEQQAHNQRAKAFNETIIAGDRTAFEKTVASGIDLDIVAPNQKAPLLTALEAPERAPFALRLIELGASLEPPGVYQNATVLMFAAGGSTPEVLQALLAKRKFPLDQANANGATALAYAVSAGRIDNVRLLLRLGADPNRRSGKDRLVDIARWQGFEEIARVLEATAK